MHTKVIAIPKDFTAQLTINLLRKLKPSSEESYHLYIIDEKNRLSGVLSIRSLLTADPKISVTKIMKKQVVKVKIDAKKDEIANALAKYGLYTLPVVDQNNILKGIVKADDVLTEIMPESWKKRIFMAKGYKK